MPSRPIRVALLLICAAGFAAMCAGHAIAGALGASLGYAHTVQAPALELAAALAAVGVVFLAQRVVAAATGVAGSARDWAPEAMAEIRALGLSRVALAVIAIQTVALICGESIEQRVAGVTVAGFAALVGSPLAIAPLVHLAVGVCAALALSSFANSVCENATALVALVRLALAWLARSNPITPHVLSLDSRFAFTGERLPLARKLASRPPPASLRIA